VQVSIEWRSGKWSWKETFGCRSLKRGDVDTSRSLSLSLLSLLSMDILTSSGPAPGPLINFLSSLPSSSSSDSDDDDWTRRNFWDGQDVNRVIAEDEQESFAQADAKRSITSPAAHGSRDSLRVQMMTTRILAALRVE
jgi:hypothetical protein